jgi:uncharacterized membrane protein
MGMEDEMQPGGAGKQGLALRVARLEEEVAALRRLIGAEGVVEAATVSAEVRTADSPAALGNDKSRGNDNVELLRDDKSRGDDRPPAAWGAVPGLPAAPNVEVPRDSFESRLGSQIFNRFAILFLILGTAYFFKLAVDRRWIVPSPTGRTIAGLAAGAAIVLWSERFRGKGYAAFSNSLKALGSGVLYLTLWAGFQLYHLLPAGVALGLMVGVTAWNAWMAWAQRSELLAAYALAGGFATPMLLSTGGNHEAFLFSYLLAIDVAAVLLVRARRWPRLLLGAFPLTVAYFIGWYVEYYAASELLVTAVFIVLFDSTFSSVAVRWGEGADGVARSSAATLIEDILLPLGNAGFLAGSFYSVLQDAGFNALLAWLMLVLAAVYLGFMRLPQSRTAAAIHLSIAVVLLTIAVPLKASGHWITVSWLVEGLALLWVAARLGVGAAGPEAYAWRALRWLGAAALGLGFGGIVAHAAGSGFTAAEFFNANTATEAIGVGVFAGAAWLGLGGGWPRIAVAAFLAIDAIGLLLTLGELAVRGPAAHPAFQSADFARALLGLAIFAGVVGVALRVGRAQAGLAQAEASADARNAQDAQDGGRLAQAAAGFWAQCAGLTTIAFNLAAVLTGVREVAAIWELPGAAGTATSLEAGLQQALAISGFLMVYGAAVLGAGFWKRSAFLRWQALLLLVFTIFKAFLYDMRSLSQGYRVVSFLGLGGLLMAISFVYQKDWLGLRAEPPGPGPGAGR